MKLSDLQKKDIIDITSGIKVGNIIDAIIDDSGVITSLVVDKYSFNFFSNRGEFIVNFKDIIKIGEDVVLVKIENN